MRATKVVVRPGRKNGGTTLVFAVRRPSVVRFTVVRVYPTCKRVGSFTVRARPGINRVRFSGRVDGRPLPDGVYRVLAQVRGHEKAVATVTLIVARRKATERELRRPRSTACSANDAHAIASAIGAAPPANENGGTSRLASALDPVVGAVKGVERTASKIAQAARTVPERIRDFARGQSEKINLTLVGLGLLAIALIGALVVLNIVRFAYRYRVFR